MTDVEEGLATDRVGAIVLAAGAGSRFGGGKLLAPLHGRPLLQHVLDTLAGVGLEEVVVVLGRDVEAVEAGIEWRNEQRLVNPEPGRGLSSSVRSGFAALVFAPVDAALVVLGDQPRLSPAVIRALLGAPITDESPVVVPRYADGASGPNPVLLLRAAWSLVDTVSGDRGLGPLIVDRPELVLEVAVAGSNPDVDTPDDLARLNGGASG